MNDAFAIGMGYGNIFVDIDGVRENYYENACSCRV